MTAMTLTEFLLARVAEDEEYAECVGFLSVFDRSRALAEREAKRRIAEESMEGADNPIDYVALGMNQAVRHLAAVYSDHPDYNEAWRA